MCSLSENASMRRKSFIFGQLALTASWVLFVLALLAAAWIPAKVIASSTILAGYSLLIIVLWAFYFITYMRSWFQSKYVDKVLCQRLYLAGTTAVMALAIFFCVWALPVIFITLPLLICGSKSGKTVLLGVVAGIGEFAALCSTVLLALLLKALLLGEWEFAGTSFRCDMVLMICGVLALAGLFARGKMLANNDWTLKSALCQPVTVAIWSITILSVIGTVAADKMQGKILAETKAEAEKVFGGELSADGLKKLYLDGRKADSTFYSKLNDLIRKINKSAWGKRSKGRIFAKPTAEDLKKRQENFVKNAPLYAELNKLVAGEIPAYPLECADGKLLELKQPQLRILRSAAFALLTQMRYDSKNALEYSKLYFNVVNAGNGTAVSTVMQSKMIKFWCKTVEMLKNGKKISAVEFAALQKFAKAQAAGFNFDSRKFAYAEAVFAYDLYRTHSLTTISATGAYFKFDRTEALRSWMDHAQNGKLDVPQRGIAKMLTLPADIHSSQYEEVKTLLNEL